MLIALAAAVTGCTLTVPTDPNGTLENVTGGTLRVGVSEDPPLVSVKGDQPTGALADLVSTFAAEHDAEVEWTFGSEESLVDGLESGELDLAIGGFTEETPWIDKAGKTRGYASIPDSQGRKIVMLVPLGENAFLSTLETFLDEEVGP